MERQQEVPGVFPGFRVSGLGFRVQGSGFRISVILFCLPSACGHSVLYWVAVALPVLLNPKP